jgi:hypothetical protein
MLPYYAMIITPEISESDRALNRVRGAFHGLTGSYRVLQGFTEFYPPVPIVSHVLRLADKSLLQVQKP